MREHSSPCAREEVLVRFCPPSGGVPLTVGESLEGQKVAVSPYAVRKSNQLCRSQHIIPPYYVWLVCEPARTSLSRRNINRWGRAFKRKATAEEIEFFVQERGEPRLPDKFFERKLGVKIRTRPKHRGSQRKYKRPPYEDFASDKPD